VAVIDTIREKVRKQEYEFAVPHFFEEMANDDLIFADVEAAIAGGASAAGLHATHAARGTRWSARRPTGGRPRSSAGLRRPAISFSLPLTFWSKRMTKKKAHNYGQCHVCGERMQERRVKQDFWVKEQLVVIEDVPAGVCPRCGERVVRAEVGLQLAALLKGSARVSQAQTMRVPVISFEKAVA
jgi:YgiT-type zinc finger domain-containing protein